MLDLALFTACPDHSIYLSKHSLTVTKFSSLALTKIKRSSANCTCEIDGLVRLTFIPFNSPFNSTLHNSITKTSEARMNRNGHRGSPCLIPLCGLKKPYGAPLIKIENEKVEIHYSTHWIPTLGKPKHLRTSMINDNSILS